MIKTKYVVGDVVVIDGKQEIVQYICADQYDMYGKQKVYYSFGIDKYYEESELV